jgi:hypothetical protein
MLTTHGEPDQTSLRVFGSKGATPIGTSWGTSEAPLFSQGLELPIFFYGGFYALYQRSSCCFPLGGKRLCGLNRQWSWVWPLRQSLQVPTHSHGGFDQ